MTGRIDVHSHLLPAVDDGSSSLEESIACARLMVAAGYTHQFCTPHFWPSFPGNTVNNIPAWVDRLQGELTAAGVPLKLLPGGEINLRPDLPSVPPEQIVSYGMNRKYCLVDIWADALPKFFYDVVRWLQSLGMTVILAHPERMKAVQDKPALADKFTDLGLLLQGNLQCFGDPPGSPTRDTAERYLTEGRYFMVGSDLHNLRTMDVRLNGLNRVIEAVGHEATDRLTIENPSKLLPSVL